MPKIDLWTNRLHSLCLPAFILLCAMLLACVKCLIWVCAINSFDFLQKLSRFKVHIDLPLNYSKLGIWRNRIRPNFILISIHFSLDFFFYDKLKEKTAILFFKRITIIIFIHSKIILIQSLREKLLCFWEIFIGIIIMLLIRRRYDLFNIINLL